jgi:hypothetical protein
LNPNITHSLQNGQIITMNIQKSTWWWPFWNWRWQFLTLNCTSDSRLHYNENIRLVTKSKPLNVIL